MKRGTIYLVSWIDTFNAIGWKDVDDMKKECKENKEWVKTVGFYIGEMHGYHVFCSQFTENPKMLNWNGMTAIPKGVIKKYKVL